MKQTCNPQHIITSEKLPQSASGYISTIIEGPPHRAVSFHERATSKDVIDELNRIIKSGDESGGGTAQDSKEGDVMKLDEACRPTGWIHVERDIDLTDPKVRVYNFGWILYLQKKYCGELYLSWYINVAYKPIGLTI